MSNRSDNFNRANSSTGLGNPSDGGSAWVEAASNFGIFGNQAYGAGGGSPTVSYLECSAADGTVQVTQASISGHASLCFRLVDSSNHFAVLVIGGAYALYRKESGTYNLLGSGGTAANGDVVSAVLSGSSIKIKQNGVERISVTDSFQSTATKHGLTTDSADASSLLDDWSFTDAAPPPSLTLDEDGIIHQTVTVW